MSRVNSRGEEIRRYLLDNVTDNPRSISRMAIMKFGITRQAVNAHLSRLVDEGALTEKGQTRNRSYALASIATWEKTYPITDATGEDIVWRQDISSVLGKLPENVRSIWLYGFTEMFNNARDHSSGTEILVHMEKTAVTTRMIIYDNGVGIFRKIQKALSLTDERQAIFELSKGKLTTDPKHHSGQGIFFTSRLFDEFDIMSGSVYFNHEFGKSEDWFAEQIEKGKTDGTAIFMYLGNHTARTPKKIFDKYLSGEPDDYSFAKTIVPVKLAQYGNDQLVSRSQAKRVLTRVDQFKKVVLDFKHVPTIGQAFADEIFRVFVNEHPNIQIIPIDTNSEVKRMILRAQSDAALSPSPSLPFDPRDEDGGDSSKNGA